MMRRTAARLFTTRSSGVVTVAKDATDPRIAVVTLNLPDKLNALTEEMGHTFSSTVKTLAAEATADPEDLRAVVLTGAGRAFSAGGDLEFLHSRVAVGAPLDAAAAAANKASMLEFYSLFLCVKDLPCPVLAAVNGHAVGAGLCLAMATDLRVVASSAKLSVNFTNIGIHPGMAASHHLPKLVGAQMATKMILTGDAVSGDEAVDIGLALKAVPADAVLDEALALARRIVRSPVLPTNQATQTLRAGMPTQADAVERESTTQAQCFGEGGADVTAALEAIVAKRK
eukprot:Rhum_TRINITY_DN4378_c0_g1::Rhum_TRINITY_DN4378_c0_g1_i1::g.14084::m.14084